MIRPTLFALASIALVGMAQAQALDINIDFNGTANQNSGVPDVTFGCVAGVAGHWNEVDVGGHSGGLFVSAPLLDTGGVSSGVTLTIDAGSRPISPFHVNTGLPRNDAALLDDACFTGGPTTFTLLGLPAGEYRVFTYAFAPDNSAYVTMVNLTGGTGQQFVGSDFQGGYFHTETHALDQVTIGLGMPLVISTNVASGYDTINGMQIVGNDTPDRIGTNYCWTTPNASGMRGMIGAQGSNLAAANDLTLTASGLPANQFGMFLLSRGATLALFAGGTSNGHLCLSSAPRRFDRPGEIRGSGAAGTFSLPVDLTTVPSSHGSLSVMAGETWYFQAWFRDPAAQGSNFTNGVEVRFH